MRIYVGWKFIDSLLLENIRKKTNPFYLTWKITDVHERSELRIGQVRRVEGDEVGGRISRLGDISQQEPIVGHPNLLKLGEEVPGDGGRAGLEPTS
jgi:hypothetical protein